MKIEQKIEKISPKSTLEENPSSPTSSWLENIVTAIGVGALTSFCFACVLYGISRTQSPATKTFRLCEVIPFRRFLFSDGCATPMEMYHAMDSLETRINQLKHLNETTDSLETSLNKVKQNFLVLVGEKETCDLVEAACKSELLGIKLGMQVFNSGMQVFNSGKWVVSKLIRQFQQPVDKEEINKQINETVHKLGIIDDELEALKTMLRLPLTIEAIKKLPCPSMG